MLEGAKLIGAGAATIASAGAAVGIGNVFSSLIHSVARNPSLAKQSFGYAILGFALTEAIASFASMTASSISFVFQCAANIYSSFLFDSLKRAPQGSNVLYVRALPSPHARERAQ
nr:ATP synthase F0 subunit 9 [Aneura pinguis]WHW96572.1 ATP synthase F0 subunit 9 [Aneura pinguis]WHW96614.1 ATP synthase F0 subunit 9 [Aneura pinguis]WHW96656.1 ATP synthase F0 subunit 9 [Aneura pinguis]WHW96698.1 ATP synthase F0 subunit 9 [Aneura pinguis]